MCVCVLQEKTVRYDEGGSSDSEHDAYLERMKAEGEERDSEDGRLSVSMTTLHVIATSLQRTLTLWLEAVEAMTTWSE